MGHRFEGIVFLRHKAAKSRDGVITEETENLKLILGGNVMAVEMRVWTNWPACGNIP